MKHWIFRYCAANSALVTLAGVLVGSPTVADPAKAAPKPAPTQIYQGELDGQEVWVELTRTPRGIAGKLGVSLQSASGATRLELPAAPELDSPPAFVPQRLDATSCTLSVAGTHPQGLRAACLQSMQGATFLTEGFPELIVEDDPSALGKQFWLRAVARESAANLAEFGNPLRRAEPAARGACARSVRIDQVLHTQGGTFVGYWTWDFCGAALLSAARAAKADPGKGPWRETAWLGKVDEGGKLSTHLAVGQRTLANDQLSLTDLGHLDGFSVISVEQRGQDAYPTGFSADSQTRVYSAPDHGPLTLALGPLLGHESSGNCSGSDLETRWFTTAPGAGPKELIVRTTKTNRVHAADACEARARVTYSGHRFNPKTAKYVGFHRADFAELVAAQLQP